jgi:hypothetical protein
MVEDDKTDTTYVS